MASKPVRIGQGGGANCTLSYPTIVGGKTVTRAYRVRAIALQHGLLQIAAESHARTMRAYYPHRRSQARFVVTFILMGRKDIGNSKERSERERFNAWMKTYMAYLLDQDVADHPAMTISIPVRNFSRRGIPVGPLSFGEHVGSMVWTQAITFETTHEPLDAAFALSAFDDRLTRNDRNTRFFYPGGQSLSGTQKPDTYDTVSVVTGGILAPGDTTRSPAGGIAPESGDVQDAVNGPSPVSNWDVLPSGKRVKSE